MSKSNIRNFAIVAHIDHGKSTLSDRLLELTGTVPKEKMVEQFLDQSPISRKRGITIKLAPVRMEYKVESGKLSRLAGSTLNSQSSTYILNLIDTPGHVDFSYEVSRTLAACEGAVLLVDATQNIQAQTLAHGISAINQNLVLIPAINKIDLPNADIEGCKKQLVEVFGFDEKEILLVSAKTGQGVKELLDTVIEKISAPKSEVTKSLKALIFDSFFDSYKGVVAQVRIIEGQTPKIGSQIVFLETGYQATILEVGFFTPQLKESKKLSAGEIGYIATGVKKPDQVRVGDTISTDLSVSPLTGYKKVKPMVYIGFYPIETKDYFELKEALSKFKLNDPAFSFESEQSQALGSGFRCGFLGLLHAEVVQERLAEEFNVNLLATMPSVEYIMGEETIDSPSRLPQGDNIKGLKEPWVKVIIFLPQNYIGSIMDLAQEKRGKFINMRHFGFQVEFIYEMPLSEMITDFYDKLKSVSSGFASLDWEFLEFRKVDAVRVDILVGGEKIDALSTIVFRPKAESIGRKMVEKLKEVLPRQNFEIALQVAIGGKVIARETIKPFRKDVTAKLYGGDRTRKDKLLEKQKKGKKKMKMIGKVQIPQEVFLSILKS